MKLKKYRRKREIPIGWKEIKLGDVFRTSSGATPLTTELSYYEGGNIPWINSGELASPYIYSTSNYITQKGFDNSSTEIYPKGTILVAMYGATAGKASMLKITACTNQAICAILPNDDYCPEFIKYNIDTLYEHLVGLSSGSARDNLSQAGLKELKLVLPKTKKEQENLIAVLSLLDSKIELNKQINDNLEAMAKQLYDYWFVQFDFPNEEGKPYKSSGGAMVYNEKLKREIPQGWDVVNYMSLFGIGNGQTIPQTNGKIPAYGGNGVVKMIAEANYSPCVIIGRVGANCGSIHYSKVPCWVSDNAIAVCPLNINWLPFVYYSLSLYDLSKNKGGSSQPLITHATLKNLFFPFSNATIDKYANIANAIHQMIHKRQNETVTLTKQRDELLPLLMNGQASVNYHL